VHFLYFELTFCESVQPCRTLCQDVRGIEHGEESAVCVYIVCAFLFSLKYINLDKKHYFNIRAFVYKVILSLDRQYAENNQGIRVPSCNCIAVAVYCVIGLLLIGNCPEDRILFYALMHGTVNTGLYRISNLI